MTERKKNSSKNHNYVFEGVKKIFETYEPLICKKCNKSFEKKTLFNAHVKSHEFDDHTYEAKKELQNDKFRPHTCNICEKKFTAKKNLLKHLRVIHKNLNEAEKLQVKKTRCPEAYCLFACRKMKDLRNHIEKYHEIKILKDTLQFPDEAGFLKWKKEEEDNSVASFVSFRSKGILRNGLIKKVLLCHRTGQYNPKGTGKHRLKSHGSCKIGVTCPAAMEVAQFPDGQITVLYYKTHLGHSQDVIHLQLSKEEREKLSERINQGFSLDAILEDVKESIDPVIGKTKRIHFLSRKDLYNIMQSSNYKKIKNCDLKGGIDDLLMKSAVNDRGSELDKKAEGDSFLAGKIQSPIRICHSTGCNTDEDIHKRELVPFYGESACYATTNAGTSQLVIVSPGVGSVAELILFHPAENVPVSLKNRPQNGETTPKSQIQSKMEPPSQLALNLSQKIEKLLKFLPKSEFLTPKQYKAINSKLDSAINVFNSVIAKERSKRKIACKKSDDVQRERGDGVDCMVTASQKVIQQSVSEAPLYAYLYNYN